MTNPTFPGVLAIDLTALGEVSYPVNQANRIWLPKKVLQSGKLITNPVDCVISMRLANGSNDAVPWGLSDGLMNSLSGAFTDVLIKVLTPGASPTLYLQTATDLVAGYCSTDGLSPSVNSGSTDTGGGAARIPVERGGRGFGGYSGL